jgi:hypothetical protein
MEGAEGNKLFSQKKKRWGFLISVFSISFYVRRKFFFFRGFEKKKVLLVTELVCIKAT